MMVAQQLYEGIDLGGETVGLISYMRTDSVNLAEEAIADIRALDRRKIRRQKCAEGTAPI